jgi:hypothetical protein
MSYGSEESGRSEVYVTSFPGRERKWLISTGGGAYSAWSRTKQKLFYQTENGHLMQVSYRVDGGSFQADQPRAWSDYVLPRGDVFTLAPDGNRIVIPVPAAESGQKEVAHAVFLVNLADELKRRFSKP